MRARALALVLVTLVGLRFPLFADQDSEPAPPDPGIAIANLFAPGVAQISEGKLEGWFYLPGTALMVGGLLSSALMPPGPLTLLQPSLDVLTEAGIDLWSYSVFAWYRDYLDKRAAFEGRTPLGRETLLQLFAAPFTLENVFSPVVLPVLILNSLASLNDENIAAIQNYWSMPSVTAAGISTTPAGAFAIVAGAATLMSLFTAVGEEVIFRGLLRDTAGDPWAALTFGLGHMGNLFSTSPFVPKDAMGVALQAAHATAMGFYLDWISDLDGRKLRHTVALHFWNNVEAYLLSFMEMIGRGQTVGANSPLLLITSGFSFTITLY